jgi:hypothetical protein
LLLIAGLTGLSLGVAVAGFLPGPIDVGLLILCQRRTEPSCHGRVLTVSSSLSMASSLNMAALPIGAAPGGPLPGGGSGSGLAAAALAAVPGAVICQLVIPARGHETVSPDGTSSAGFSC